MIPEGATGTVTVSIPSKVLESIFDDCDRYDHEETGGRVIGAFRHASARSLEIVISGVIEAGPSARRSSLSFFQDGDYQAEIFRTIEAVNPEIEHLGNWHTHHVNGYPTLSGGDIATYRRIVNHKKHNLDFFYALLVVARSPAGKAEQRYSVRHYILFRGDDDVYEIEPRNIIVTQDTPLWPVAQQPGDGDLHSHRANAVRVRDDAIIPGIFPTLRPYWSKRVDTLYWRGHLELVDGSSVEITVPEVEDPRGDGGPQYQVLLKNPPVACADAYKEVSERQFASATHAVVALEQSLNRALFRSVSGRGGV